MHSENVFNNSINIKKNWLFFTVKAKNNQFLYDYYMVNCLILKTITACIYHTFPYIYVSHILS